LNNFSPETELDKVKTILYVFDVLVSVHH
jgi:hypothetical protein